VASRPGCRRQWPAVSTLALFVDDHAAALAPGRCGAPPFAGWQFLHERLHVLWNLAQILGSLRHLLAEDARASRFADRGVSSATAAPSPRTAIQAQ